MKKQKMKIWKAGMAAAVLAAVLLAGCGDGSGVRSAADGAGGSSGYEEEDPDHRTAAAEDGQSQNNGPAAAQDEEVKKSEEELLEERVASYLAEMTLEEKAAQLFVVCPEAITGVDTVTAAGSATRKALKKYPVGGLIYMKSNLISPDQTREMLAKTEEYYEEITGLPIFLAVDEEGGTVVRVADNSSFGVRNVGSMKTVGETGDPQQARQVGETIGGYLGALGFNLDFAPVADVLTNPDNTVVRDRSFGSDSRLVTDMVLGELDGFEGTGVLACVKHFPGHGCTAGDTHEGYAYSDRTMEELAAEELRPFAAAVERKVPFIMAAHISLPQITGDDTPATESGTILTGLLREEMGYEGIIITDAMNMGAIADHYSSAEAAVGALQAGADMILMPVDFPAACRGVLDAVDSGELTEERIDESLRRILRVKLSGALSGFSS